MKKEDKVMTIFAIAVCIILAINSIYTNYQIKLLKQKQVEIEKEHNKSIQVKIDKLYLLQQKYKKEQFKEVDIYTLNDIELLAINNYYESRGVGKNNFTKKKKDMQNITSVVLNRLDSKKYGKNINEVLHSSKVKNGKRVCQFSWACDTKKQKINKKSKEWKLAYSVAFDIYTEIEPRTVKASALHYYNPQKVEPAWAKNSKVITYVITGHKIVELK